MPDYIANLEGQDYTRLMRLAQMLNDGNAILRAIADHPVTGYTYVLNNDRIEISVRLEQGDARGR